LISAKGGTPKGVFQSAKKGLAVWAWAQRDTAATSRGVRMGDLGE